MDGDLPVISLPTDSTRIDVPAPPRAAAPPSAPLHAAASEGRPELPRRPITELRKPAVASPPTSPIRSSSAPLHAPASEGRPAVDSRNASDLRRAPAPSSAPFHAAPSEGRPLAPKPVTEARKPAPPPPTPVEAAPVEEDPEKLLREYTDRQRTKITRLEAQLVELRKVAAERDQFRARSEALAKELEGAKRQLEASSKQDAVIKDLQAKVDASLLAHSMAADENGKLKAKAQELASLARKLEEKAGAAEKGLADATKSLASQTEGRKEAEARIAGALHALQGEAPAKKPSSAHPQGGASEGRAVVPAPPAAVRK